MPLNTTKAPWATQAWSKRERLTALASFVTDFSDPEFNFGEWAGGGEKDGVLTMPWFDCSPTASRFLKVLYDYGFVRRYLERHSQPPLSLRQVDPLIRQLHLYRDLIEERTQEPPQ